MGHKERSTEGSAIVRDNLGLPVSLVLRKNNNFIFEKGIKKTHTSQRHTGLE